MRIQAGYLNHHGSPQLFYKNDIESINHVLKHDANWEVQSLSRIVMSEVFPFEHKTERNE